MSKAQAGTLVVAFILMRLATGYHFFTEGMAKHEPGFTSEHFLRAAKGPLADKFKSYAPGPHRMYELLWQPKQWDTATEEQEGDQEPRAPYADWADQIRADWKSQHDAFVAAAAKNDEAREQAEKVHESAVAGLNDYLKSIEEDIEEFQHSLWRLEELKRTVHNEGGALPYQDDRIAEMERESLAAVRPWVAEVKAIEDSYHEELMQLAGDDAPMTAIQEAVNPPTKIDHVNTAVKWVVLGAGALLFVGLFTRVAAIVASLFLASVIASQPPWVYGADTTYLGYQLVEITALLAIAAIGAGRWWGLDGVLWGLCGLCCGKKKTAEE